jgi:hypothetical protein
LKSQVSALSSAARASQNRSISLPG